MKLAKEQKIIVSDPADGCALPQLEHKEMKTLPVEQLSSFLREAKDSGVFEMYYVELATGLRRGELLGLKWEDIDLEKGNLRVKRQIARIDGKVVEAPLKTKNAYRTLPLAEDTIAVLKQQKKKVGSSHWVFPSPTGGLISPDSVLHMLHRVLKRAGPAQGFGSTICGTRSLRWPSRTAWTSRRCLGCWDTSRQASPWTPTPTSRQRPRRRRPRPWKES